MRYAKDGRAKDLYDGCEHGQLYCSTIGTYHELCAIHERDRLREENAKLKEQVRDLDIKYQNLLADAY
jgi:hypothetical protein